MALTSAVPRGAGDLPQELVDNIIGCMRDSLIDLRACSLVCKSWSAPASRHLFANFEVKKNRIRALLPLLESSERIRNAVTSLTLGSDHVCYVASQFPPQVTGPHISEETLQVTFGLEEVLAIMAQLPRLRCVDMRGLSLKSIPNRHSLDDIQDMHFDLEMLRIIDIWDFVFEPSSIIRFFSAFDEIHYMSFELIQAFPIPTNIPTSVPQDRTTFRPVVIHSLTLACGPMSPFPWMADMFEAICESDKLTRLRLQCQSEDCEATISFYRRLLPRFKYLKELQINVPMLSWSLATIHGKGLRGTCQSHISHTN